MVSDSMVERGKVIYVAEHIYMFALRCWNSSTLMTWANYISSAAGLLVITPLVLARFSAQEVTVWYLFATILSLIQILDFGLTPTFTRLISYGHGGLPKHLISDLRDVSGIQGKFSGANWHTIEAVTVAMARTFSRTAWLAWVLLLAIGLPVLLKPIGEADSQPRLWIAYGVIVLGAPRLLYGRLYTAYLSGINRVALTNRLQAIFRFVGVFNSFVVLWLGGDILEVIVVTQLWDWAALLRNRWLARRIECGKFVSFNFGVIDRGVMNVAWSAAWKTGLTTFIYMGYTQGFSLVIAQVGKPSQVASYLLAMRILTVVEQFSMVPFFSKMPIFAKLRAQGRIEAQTRLAQVNMRISYWAFLFPVALVGAIGSELIHFIGSDTHFIEPLLWWALAFAILITRFTSMHLQLYMISNHIISLQVALPTLAASIIVTYISVPVFGMYSLPIGIACGYILWGAWYIARKTYNGLNVSFFRFESTVAIPPFVCLSVIAIWKAVQR